MGKIYFGNNDISKIMYSGFTINKVYACSGQTVWESEDFVDKIWMRIQNYPSEFVVYEGGWRSGVTVIADEGSIPCDGESIVMTADDDYGFDELFFGFKIYDTHVWKPYVTDVIIGNCVDTIKGNAFCCTYSTLSSVTIPNTVTSIGDNAFNGCSGLTSIHIPTSVTSIGGQAFQNCVNLKSIYIPDSVTTLGILAFDNCMSLSSATIGEGITVLEKPFSQVVGLETCVVGSNVNELKREFIHNYNSNALRYILFKSTTPPIAYSSSTFPSQGNYVIYVPPESVEAYKTSNYGGWYQVRDRIEAIPNDLVY